MKAIKVKQIISKAGNPVANQFKIYTPKGVYFQSYTKIIAFIPNDYDKKTILDSYYWDFSRTTSKYRNIFLRENTQVTKEKIKNGEYLLNNLN